MISQTISHYKIIEKLGAGGMGVVYKAQDVKLNRMVVLKFLPMELTADADAVNRFINEAQTASALDHANICTIYEIDETPTEGRERMFICMAYYEGETLRKKVIREQLSVSSAIDIAKQIAAGLQRAHEAGIIHRDIKPENIIITTHGEVKIIDFGIAILAGQSRLTKTGSTLGTMMYISPEQLQGKAVDHRADIWALGVVLYEMLAGQAPFRGDYEAALVYAIAHESPQPLVRHRPETSEHLQRIMDKALDKNPDTRYQRVVEVLADLQRLHAAAEAPRFEKVFRAKSTRQWNRGMIIAMVLALVVAGTGIYLFLFDSSHAPHQAWTIRPLTSFAGLEHRASWSPDGSLIAFGHIVKGNLDVLVMPAGGGNTVQLTDNPADDVAPRWSPNGRFVAFVSDRGTGSNIYLIPPLGGVERKLVETNVPSVERTNDAFKVLGAQAWSPDGQELLFSRLQSTGEIAVWKVNLATGKETQMTYPLAGNADLSASWSFDGERIVFVRRQRGRSSLWLLAAEGGEPHELLFDQYNSLDPAWSPDSRRIVFSSDRAGSVNLWEIEIDSQRLRQLTAGSGSDVEPAIARDGRLAYSQFSHQVDLYCLQIDSAKEERLTFSTRDNFHARFSPDGKKIVYQSNRTGNDEIWLLDVETKAERPLTNHPAIDGAPDWSPDGREIVFLSNREEDGFHLWVMNAEGESLRRLTKQPIPGTVEGYQTVTLRCSPDGKVIGYLAPSDQGMALWILNKDSQNARPRLFNFLRFDWYQDSHHVVYTGKSADGSGVLEIRVANLETGQERLLHQGPHAELVVAPDGRSVAYCHAISHLNMNLYLLRLLPPDSPSGLPQPLGAPVQMTHGEGLWHVHNGGFSPDGKKIVYSRDTDQSDIYVIENYK